MFRIAEATTVTLAVLSVVYIAGCSSMASCPEVPPELNIPILSSDSYDENRAEYIEVGTVQFTCTSETCSELSHEVCWERLKRQATLEGGTALVFIENRTTGTGHGGGILTSVGCSGLVIKEKHTEKLLKVIDTPGDAELDDPE